MVLSRAAFGVHGQKVPGVISWLTSIGWETVLAISAVLATATVFDVLGAASGQAVTVIAAVLIAALIVVASVPGYHTIMRDRKSTRLNSSRVASSYAAFSSPQ